MKHYNPKSQKEIEVIRKLKTVKTKQQLKKLLNNLQDQNQKLLHQVKQLRDKVQALLQKHKLKNSDKKQSQLKIKAQIDNIKLQLQGKYKKMKDLKKKVQDNEPVDDNLLNSDIDRKNKIKKIEDQFAQMKILEKDLKKQNKHLQISVKQIQKEMTNLDPKIIQLQAQNTQFRKKIFSLRKDSQQNHYQSVKAQQTLTKTRNHYRQNVRLSMQDLKGVETPNKQQLLKKQQQLKNQIVKLKKQVQLVEQKSFKRQIDVKKQKQKLITQNKGHLQKLKSSQTFKIKLETELNKYKILWKKVMYNKERNAKKPQFSNQQAQINQFQDKQPLRRDFVGIIGKHRFDDRLILQNDKKAFIKGMISYQNQKGGLAAIKCIYSNGLISFLPPSLQNYLSKCKTQKIQVAQDDFIKVIKIKAKSDEGEGKILKIEALSNKNIKKQIGQKREFSDLSQNQISYAFDISVQQYPVSAFGSFIYIKGHWYLQSFGVQINQL